MHVEYHRWWSESLNRDMELKVYGHWGKPFIVFPCSKGRFFDYENMGMINAISHFIDAGKIKLFTVDSVDEESWYKFSILPGDRNRRHEEYDQYILKEVVPFVRKHCQSQDEKIMTTGCSMGAYHALNFLLKYPDIFEGTIALSGLYRLDRGEFGLPSYDIPHVYFNSPINYLSGLSNNTYLKKFRESKIIICAGQGAWEDEALADTRELDRLFKEKNVPVWIDYWGHDVNHDWPWWYKQMNYFLGHLFP
jgi:esterase/lipase superfamily enzyme